MAEIKDISAQEAGKAPDEARGPGRRLHGAIAHKLGTEILSGKYAPGDILSGEVAFAEELQVSRSAYREAIQVLSAKGLVASRPKAGTRVLPKDRWNLLDPDVLGWAFAGEPDIEFVRSCLKCALWSSLRRRDLPRSAATRMTSSHEGCAGRDAQARPLPPRRGAPQTGIFTMRFCQATRNQALMVLSASIGAAVNWTTQFKQRSRALPRNPIPDHARVYDAIAAGDGEGAAEAMNVLVDLALEDTRSAMLGD